ncbi:MAG: hypothetical protein LH702_01145 [Phormidesmis sp. CAN_BIN44]|nr:hypothetical protein [Phormidesmis sp. CAN_BIN44]
MPFGIVEVICDKPIQTIPSHPIWVAGRRSRRAKFPLKFHNKTNQVQRITVTCNNGKQQPIQWLFQDAIEVKPSEEKIGVLQAKRARPWLGWSYRDLLEVAVELANPESGKSSDGVQACPSTQILEVLTRPWIPFWLQVATIALTSLWGIAVYTPFPIARHDAVVTSVRISLEDPLRPIVISASNDKTVRRWKTLDKTPLQNLSMKPDVPLEDVLKGSRES